jgi:hypothetical protein
MISTIKKFFSNIFGQTNYKSPKQIVRYVQKIHKSGWQKIKRKDIELMLNHSGFILKEIPLDNENVKWVTTACRESYITKYSKLKTQAPPIVIDCEGNIIDGEHRSIAAKIRGDKTIKAYVGFRN